MAMCACMCVIEKGRGGEVRRSDRSISTHLILFGSLYALSNLHGAKDRILKVICVLAKIRGERVRVRFVKGIQVLREDK